MRNRTRTASPGAKRRVIPLIGRNRRPAMRLRAPRIHPLAAAVILAIHGSPVLAAGPAANNIVIDGRTQTGVQVNGATTRITTSTLKGGNAFNSFSHFSVGKGNTVNLMVPTAAANLVNLVHDSKSVINGVLNSYKNGQIGGNVFFANPHGFVVGASGIVNVGSLSVSTPTRAFLDQVIGADGSIDTQFAQRLMSGDIPLSQSGVISIEGRINALDAVTLRGWDVTVSGAINAGPAAAVQVAMFDNTVNSEGLEHGAQLVSRNGVIEIIAGNDVAVSGSLVADGMAGSKAGRINVEARRDIFIEDGALLSAKGVGAASAGGDIRVFADRDSRVAGGTTFLASAGSSGDGGLIEVSAIETVALSGGTFDTSATNGKLGLFYVDPNNIEVYNAGRSIEITGNYAMEANERITVAADGHITTVHTEGESGYVWLKAPTIEIEGLIDTSNRDNFKSGDVTLIGRNISVTGTIDASSDSGQAGKISLLASDESLDFQGMLSASSSVSVSGTLKGGDIVIDATSKAISSYNSTDDAIGGTVISNVFGSGLGITAGVVGGHADAAVNIRGTADIQGTGDVTINARGVQTAETPVLTFDLFNPISMNVVYGEVKGTVSAAIENGARITTGAAGTLQVKARSEATVDVSALAFLTDTDQYVAATAAFGKADITTSASIAGGAAISAGNVAVLAQNENSFSATATAAANKAGVLGVALAVSDFKTTATAFNGATLGVDLDAGAAPAIGKVGNVTVEATSNTRKNKTGASTDVGSSLGAKVIFAAGGDEAFAAARYVLSAGQAKTKGNAATSTTTPWKVGSAISIADSSQKAFASIAKDGAAAAPQIDATGDVVVHARVADEGVRNFAGSYINSSTSDEGDVTNPAARKSVSLGIAIGNYEHESKAAIGDKVQVTAEHIGVGAETVLPVTITWDKYENLQSILGKLNPRLGIEKEVFTSYANAQGSSIEGGLYGSVNIFQVDNDTAASVGSGAKLTATALSDAGWQSALDTGMPAIAWLDPIAVAARNVVATVNVGGNWSPIGLGSGAGDNGTTVGGAFNYVNYSNRTRAGVGAGAELKAEAAGIRADSTDQVLSISPTSGGGGGKAANAIIAVTDIDNQTEASVSNLARVEAGAVSVQAHEALEVWSAAGALTKSNSLGIGISVAANDISTQTRAFVGNNTVDDPDNQDDWLVPADTYAAGSGYLHADSLDVAAGSDGQVNALAIAASDVSSENPSDPPSTMDKLKDKVQGLESKLGNKLQGDGIFARYLGNKLGDKLRVPNAPPLTTPDPKYGVAVSGSASINLANLDTLASVEGIRLDRRAPGGSGAIDTSVKAVSMTDLISASGGAAMVRAKNPSSTHSEAVAGAVAYSEIENTTDARISGVTASHAGDTSVLALGGGFEVTVALGLAVNTSSNTAKAREGTASASIATIDNDTTASITDSIITGDALEGGIVDVTAYSQSLIGTGGGAFFGGGKSALGIAVTYSEIDNATRALVLGTDIDLADGLTLQALDASTIVGGAAMGGGGKETDSFAGGVVFNQIDNTVEAGLRGNGTRRGDVDTTGNVIVKARSTAAIGAYEAMLDDAVPAGANRDSGISLEVSYGDNDMPFGNGNLIIGGAGILQRGGSNVGMGVVFNEISNSYLAVIENADVDSSLGSVIVDARDQSTLIGISVGFGQGRGGSGVGMASVNIIDNRVESRVGVDEATAAACASITAANCSTNIDANGLTVSAGNEAEIWALAGAVAFSGSTAAGGAVSYNETSNESLARVNAARVDVAPGGVTVTGTSSSDIKSMAVAISVGASNSIAIAVDWNVIADDVLAEVSRSAVRAQSLAVLADQAEGLDGASILAISGAGAGFNINEVDNDLTAHVGDSALVVPGIVNVAAYSDADIQAFSGGLVYAAGGASLGIAIASNTITNTVTAGITNTSQDQSTSDTTVSAIDDSNIQSMTLALAGGSNAGSVALAYNRIDNDISAFIRGNAAGGTQKDFNARNVVVSAVSDADIETLALGVAGGGQVGATGSAASNLMGTDVTAEISGNAHVRAANNVGVLAHNEDSIAVIAGAAGLSGGAAGVGISVVVNQVDGDTRASISGAGTMVDTAGLDATDTLSVNSGALVDPIDVSGIEAPSAQARDMSEVQEAVSGLAVVASSHQAVATNAVTLGISISPEGGGVAIVPVVSLMGGKTTAYIENAQIDTRLTDDPTVAGYHAPDIQVTASSHTFGQNFVAAIGGGGALGIAAAASGNRFDRDTDAHVSNATIGALYTREQTQVQVSQVQAGGTAEDDGPDAGSGTGAQDNGTAPPTTTTTHTTVNRTLVPRVGDVNVKARASQGSADIVAGGAAGGGAGAGTVIVNVFSADTRAWVTRGALSAHSLDVSADTRSGYNALTASAAVGASSGAGAFIVSVAGDTTHASVGDSGADTTLALSGSLSVTANTEDDYNSLLISGALGGGAGIAGMAGVTIVENNTAAGLYRVSAQKAAAATPQVVTDASGNTTTTIDQAAGGRLLDGLDDVTVSATEKIGVEAYGGALGGGGAAGIGAGANVVIVKSLVTGEIVDSKLDASGTISVAAKGTKDIDAITVTAGVGGTVGIGGAAGVVLVGDGGFGGAMGELDRENENGERAGTLTAVNEASSNSTGAATNGTGLSQQEQQDLGNATSYNIASTINGALQDAVTASVSGGALNAAAVTVDAQGVVTTRNIAGAGGAGTVGVGGAVAYTRVYDNITAATTSTTINAARVSVTASMLDGDDGRAADARAYAGAAGLVGLGAAIVDVSISNNVTAAAGGNYTGTAANDMTVKATDDSSANAEGVGAAVGAAAAGVVISTAEKRSNVQSAVLANSRVAGFRSLAIDASNQGQVDAMAVGAAGGLVAAGAGASASAYNISTVKAFTGTNVALPDGDVSIVATNASDQSAHAVGVAGGGIVAASGAVALASSGKEGQLGQPEEFMVTEATLGNGNTTATTRSGKLTVHAVGSDSNSASSMAGAGGVLAGNAAISKTEDRSKVKSSLGTGTTTTLYAGEVDLYAEHRSNYGASADSVNASVLGGSGAESSNWTKSTVDTVVAANVDLKATGKASLGAINYFQETEGDPSAVAAGGGGFNGSGAVSDTTLEGASKVTVGANAKITSGTNPFTNPGGIEAVAATILHHSDEVKLMTGGAITAALTRSTLDADFDNGVDIGADAKLTTQGGIDLGTFTQAYADLLSLVSTYGVAAVGGTRATAEVTANQWVNVGDRAQLSAFQNIEITPGETSDYGTIMMADSRAFGYVRGIIAVPAAYAEAYVDNYRSVNIGTGAVVKSAQNVVLGADEGILSTFADGAGHGYALGFIPFEAGDENHNPRTSSSVTVNGSVLAGMYNKLKIRIPNSPDSGAGNKFSSAIVVDEGEFPFEHSYDPAFSMLSFIDDNMDGPDGAVLANGVSTTPVGLQKFGTLFASGGTVTVHADNAITVGATGSIRANGAPEITIDNYSRDYLMLEGAVIPNVPGGRVLFTGAVGSNRVSGLNRVTESGRDVPGIISITNHWNSLDPNQGGIGNSNLGAAMLVTGPMTNLGGAINLKSVSGSFSQTGQVFGQSVNLDFPQGVAVVSIPGGTFNANGNAPSQWGNFMIWPGGNPANGDPDANAAVSWVVNSMFYDDRFTDATHTTLRTADDFTRQLIGTEGTMPENGPHGNNSYVFYGNCAAIGAGDCSGATSDGLSPLGRSIVHAEWNWYSVVPVQQLTKFSDSYADANISSAQSPTSIFGSQVSITARYININGRISAGQPTNWSVNLPAGLVDTVKTYNYQYNVLGRGPLFDVGFATANGTDQKIKVQYDARTQQLVVDDVNASSGGGFVRLRGGILNTSGPGSDGNPLGQIHINGGLGQVAINNQTGIPLVLKSVNAGDTSLAQALTSQVEIIDTLQKFGGATNPDHWWYVYRPGQGVSVYNNANGASALTGSNGEIIASQVTGTDNLYRPRQDVRWKWQLEAQLGRGAPYYWDYSTGTRRLVEAGVTEWDWISKNQYNENDPWLFRTDTGALSSDPSASGIEIRSGHVFEQEITGSAQQTWQWNIYHEGCDGYYGSECHYDYGQTMLDPARSYWYFHFYSQANLTMKQSVKADNPIAINFAGNATGQVTVNSNAPVTLSGNIINPNGQTTITATQAATELSNTPYGLFQRNPGWNQALTATRAGSFITQTGSSYISTNGLTLASSAGIGTDANHLRATLAAGGRLDATAGTHGIYLDLGSGAAIGNVSAGDALNGYRDVSILADGDLTAAAAGTNVTGRSITLKSALGAIGSSAAPLVISAHASPDDIRSGIVNVEASGNIGLRQVGGDLLVGSITSNGGYVDIDVPNGSIQDASGLTSAQALGADELRKVWQELHLTSEYGAEAKAVETSVAPFEAAVVRDYHYYWTLAGHGDVDSSGHYVLKADSVALFQDLATAAHKTAQQYAADEFAAVSGKLAANIGADWKSQPAFASHQASFTYTATAAQVAALTENSVWTENQLSVAIRQQALEPDAGPRPVGTGVPNIVALSSGSQGAGNVRLSASGDIGKLAAPVVITGAQLESGVLSAEQNAALAMATAPGDVALHWIDAGGNLVTLDNSGAQPVWRDALGNVMTVPQGGQVPNGVRLERVVIRQTAPLFVNAPGAFTATAGGDVYVQSAQKLNLDRVQAQGVINLASKTGIAMATPTTAAPQIVSNTGDVTLVVEQGDIGTDAANPLSYQTGGKLALATAGGNIWLLSMGNTQIGNVAANGDVSLEAVAGSILADPAAIGFNVRGDNIVLRALAGNIGSAATPFDVAVASDGELNGEAGGSAWIHAPAFASTPGSLQIGSFAAGGDLTVTSAFDLAAGTLTTTSGSVVAAAGHDASVDAIAAGGGARVTAVNDAVIGSVSAGGDVNLLAGNMLDAASASQVTAGGDVTFTAGQDIAAGAVLATGGVTMDAGDVLAMSAGAAIASGADISLTAAHRLTANAISAVGNVGAMAGDALEITAGSDITAGGDVSLTATRALTVDAISAGGNVDAVAGNALVIRTGSAVTAGGHAALSAGDALAMGNLSAGAAIDLLAGDALQVAAGSQVIAGTSLGAQGSTIGMGAGSSMSAGAGIGMTSTAGDIVLGKVQSGLAGGTAVTIDSAARIAGNGDGQQNIIADEAGAGVVLQAGTGIGGASRVLELDTPALQADTAAGGIYIHNAGALQLAAVSVPGAVEVSADGALTFDTVTAGANVSLEAANGLTGNAIDAGGNVVARAGDALDIQFVTTGASAQLVSGGDMTLDTVDARNDVALDFGGNLSIRNFNAATATLSGREDIIIDNAQVRYGLNLAATNIQVGVTQTAISPALKMNVTGYGGTIANTVALDIDAPAGVAFGKLWGNQVGVTTTADSVRIADANITGAMTLRTPSVDLLADNRDQAPRQVNVQLYEPDFRFALTQQGKATFTDAYVLRFDAGYSVGVPNFTSNHAYAPLDVFGVSVISEATRNSRYRGPYEPVYLPPARPGPWAVPWSQPIEPVQEGGAVNVSGLEGPLHIAKQ